MIGQLLTGRYLILEQLGSGGFSETYLARDKYLPHHPLCVAKCLKLSPNNTIPLTTAQRMFQTEAQVLAALGQHHAQIPNLLAFSQDQELMYQIQDYVEGKSLGQLLVNHQRLTSEAAIALLLDVLPVLQYVHSHHIIHRDLKPSNLIQSAQTNRIVLIDFGAVCRLVQTAAGWQPHPEDANLAIGTPGYMPKEQQAGKLEFSTDLYGLGVSIIFLLTGVHPRKLEHNPISGELDWQKHLGDRALHPGLNMVLSGMTRAQASDRYQTATEVLQAVQTCLAGALPTQQSNSESITFQQRKPKPRSWLQMTRRSLTVAGVVLCLVGGGYLYTHQPSGASILPLYLGKSLPNQPLTLIHTIPISTSIDQLVITPSDRHLITASRDRILRIWTLPDGKLIKMLPVPSTQVTALAVSPDSKWFVSGGSDRVIHLWDLGSGKYLHPINGHTAPITALAISPDAQVIASGSEDGTIRLWNCQTRVRQQSFARFGSAITALIYGTTPDTLISANRNAELQVWNLRTGQLQRTFTGHTAPILRLQMLNAETLLSVGQDRTLLWNLKQEELVQASGKQSVPLVTAAVGDRRVITLNNQGTLQTWNPDTDQFQASSINVRPLAATLSPNQQYLASWSADQHLKLWQLREAKSP